MAMLRRGLTGEPVRILQEKLGVTADGIFGKNTEAALLKYQAAHGLSADGIAGPDTFTAMELHELVLLHKPIRGQMVKKVQEALGIGADGIFGSGTEAAVRKFQTDNGLDVNGMVDPKMLAMLPGFDVPQEKVEASLEVKNQLLAKVYNRRAVEVDQVVEELLAYVDRLRPLVADTSLLLNQALDRGETVLFEGAQATMLDVDHGTYPFVTSSSAVAGGVCTGAGIGPTRIDRVIGVIKAYTTRVGSGPFPTELFDEDGEKLWKIGGEVGVSTGRDRRCGWYDVVVARYAARVNGLTDLFLTKLDVLSSWEKVPVCVAYEIDGVRHDEMPMTQTDFHHAKPIYEHLDGWWEDISGCRTFDELPTNAQRYVQALEELSGTRIWGVGVGPGREQTLVVHD